MSAALQSFGAGDFVSLVQAYSRLPRDAADVPNLATHVDFVGAGPSLMPVTVNDGETGNCWVCSPYTAYVLYSQEELRRLASPLLAAPLCTVCGALGSYLRRARIDKAVAVNNWMLSTNIYPDLNGDHLRNWIEEAQQRWPGHAIWFRSLNQRYTPAWLDLLKALGCELIPSRQVYLYDQIDVSARLHANLRRDLKLLQGRRCDLTSADSWSEKDFERAADLYQLLYIEKYSPLNPRYRASFLRSWHAAGLLNLFGYRDASGALEAVVGIFAAGTTLTAPIVGYDTAAPPARGLYRLLMATVFDLAASSGRRVNLSAGAAEFKRLRGGVGTIEYSAVCVRHLTRRRQRAIGLLAALSRSLGEPLMRRFQW
ncbi:MAG TPA: GNAT family N-acetyltransferase [Steroidobacteraceae bacterium]|jgi:hypothetical protein